jgi:hypothetical protein
MNIVADAVYLSDPTDVVDHVSRGLYQLSNYVLRGLPRGWQVNHDLDAYLKTITFIHEGKIVNPRPWPLGRNGPPIFEGMSNSVLATNESGSNETVPDSTSTDRNLARQSTFMDFAEQEHNAGRLIPLVAEDYNGIFDRSTVDLGPVTQQEHVLGRFFLGFS